MNEVKLSGRMKVRKSFPQRDGKKALVFGSIKVDGGPIVDCKAFDQAAMDLGNAHELEVEIRGHLAVDKRVRDGKTEWRTIVVVEKVVETQPIDEVLPRDIGDETPF